MAATSTGTFQIGDGAVSLHGATIALNGDVAIAADKDLHMTTGSGTFSSGTGAVTLNGDIAIAKGQNLFMSIAELPGVTGRVGVCRPSIARWLAVDVSCRFPWAAGRRCVAGACSVCRYAPSP